MRAVVVFDAGFAKRNTWMLAPEGGGVRVRLTLGSANEVVLDVPLWVHRRSSGQYRMGALHCRRYDETTWLVESSTHGGLVPRLELLLTCATSHASESLETL